MLRASKKGQKRSNSLLGFWPPQISGFVAATPGFKRIFTGSKNRVTAEDRFRRPNICLNVARRIYVTVHGGKNTTYRLTSVRFSAIHFCFRYILRLLNITHAIY